MLLDFLAAVFKPLMIMYTQSLKYNPKQNVLKLRIKKIPVFVMDQNY